MRAARIWTTEDDEAILGWRDAGMLLNEIAARMGINRTSISERLVLLHDRRAATAGKPPPPPRQRRALPAASHPSKPGARKCLGCSGTFASAHAGNRLCYRCLKARDSRTLFDPL